MPESNFLYLILRQSLPSTNTTDSNTEAQSTTSVTTDPPTPTLSNTQASTITTIQLSTTQPGSTQATSAGSLTSSSLTPQSTSSSDVGTTTSVITTSSQPESTTSSSLTSSTTSSETLSSTPTSQPPTSTTSSVSSSSRTLATAPAITTTTATTATATTTTTSSSPSSISQNNPTSTTHGGQITSTITSSFVTVIGSSSITSTTLIPTVISSSSNTTTGETDRTAVIAGSVIGGGLFLIIGLSVLFYRQRQRFKHFHFLDAINVRRRQARVRATLLAGEDLEDVDLPRPPPGRYSDHDTPWDPRDSSGSLNDTERGKLMGPVVHDEDIDLSHIVDDVMGPSASGVQYSQNSLSSSFYDLSGHESAPQTRERPNASQIALLEAAGLSSMGGPSMQPTPPGNNDPVVIGGGNTL